VYKSCECNKYFIPIIVTHLSVPRFIFLTKQKGETNKTKVLGITRITPVGDLGKPALDFLSLPFCKKFCYLIL